MAAAVAGRYQRQDVSKGSGPVARHRGGAHDHPEVVNVIVRRIGEALDALAGYAEGHDWAALALMALLALMVCTADGWFA